MSLKRGADLRRFRLVLIFNANSFFVQVMKKFPSELFDHVSGNEQKLWTYSLTLSDELKAQFILWHILSKQNHLVTT